MKRLLSSLLLLTYLIILIRPLIPFVEYGLNRNFIIAELCENRDKPELKCDGKCYLSKRLKQVSSAPSPERNSQRTILLDFETRYSHLHPFHEACKRLPKLIPSPRLSDDILPGSVCISVPVPPPWFKA